MGVKRLWYFCSPSKNNKLKQLFRCFFPNFSYKRYPFLSSDRKFDSTGDHPKMKADIEIQGKLKRSRLESAKRNSELSITNIEELGSAEARDSNVQTKVRSYFDYGVTAVKGERIFVSSRLRCLGMAPGLASAMVTCNAQVCGVSHRLFFSRRGVQVKLSGRQRAAASYTFVRLFIAN